MFLLVFTAVTRLISDLQSTAVVRVRYPTRRLANIVYFNSPLIILKKLECMLTIAGHLAKTLNTKQN